MACVDRVCSFRSSLQPAGTFTMTEFLILIALKFEGHLIVDEYDVGVEMSHWFVEIWKTTEPLWLRW